MIDEDVANLNPNVNCLEGKRCPQCKSYGPFELSISTRVLLYDSGIREVGGDAVEYGEDAYTVCCSCQRRGQFADFDERST